jgi:hypothetical protein
VTVAHPTQAIVVVIVAAVLIVYGRVRRRLPIAIAGYVMLAVAALLALVVYR